MPAAGQGYTTQEHHNVLVIGPGLWLERLTTVPTEEHLRHFTRRGLVSLMPGQRIRMSLTGFRVDRHSPVQVTPDFNSGSRHAMYLVLSLAQEVAKSPWPWPLSLPSDESLARHITGIDMDKLALLAIDQCFVDVMWQPEFWILHIFTPLAAKPHPPAVAQTVRLRIALFLLSRYNNQAGLCEVYSSNISCKAVF